MQINTVIFDKTGTITEGRPRVIRFYSILPANQLSLRRLLMLLGSAESSSEHPLGAAIVCFAKQVIHSN
jgi:Cu+-exporting ATPase